MRNFFTTLIHLLLAVSLGIAQPLEKPEDEALYEKFGEKAYNFDFNAANKIADSLLTVYPNSPLGFHAYSLLQTWYFLGSRNDGLVNAFFVFSDSSLSRFEKINDAEKNAYYLFRLGEEYAFRSIMHAFERKNFDAFWAAKNSVAYFNDALELSPEFYDAYSGPAVFSYFLSFAPSFLRAGLNLIGIETDVGKSLAAFRLTFEKGDFAKTEAAFQLAKIYSDYYFDIDSSNYYLYPLLKKYPGNIFFKYQAAINSMRSKQFEKAEKILEKITKYENKNFEQIVAFSYFLLGETAFAQNKFQKAIYNYEQYFENTRSVNFLGYSNYKCAIAYLMLGEKAKAKDYLLQSQYGNEENYKDALAHKRSMQLLENNFETFDRNLVLMENFISTGNYAKAFDLSDKLKQPGNLRSIFASAEAAIETGYYKIAKAKLKDLNKFHFENKLNKIKFLYLHALFDYRIGNYGKALKMAEKIFEIDNQNTEIFAKARALIREIKNIRNK